MKLIESFLRKRRIPEDSEGARNTVELWKLRPGPAFLSLQQHGNEVRECATRSSSEAGTLSAVGTYMRHSMIFDIEKLGH